MNNEVYSQYYDVVVLSTHSTVHSSIERINEQEPTIQDGV